MMVMGRSQNLGYKPEGVNPWFWQWFENRGRMKIKSGLICGQGAEIERPISGCCWKYNVELLERYIVVVEANLVCLEGV